MTVTTKRTLKIHYRRDKDAIAFIRFWRAVNHHWFWEKPDAIHN
jgi:hypothetical protein